MDPAELRPGGSAKDLTGQEARANVLLEKGGGGGGGGGERGGLAYLAAARSAISP